tara:strand:- start:453 stop:641 length:189 start_codon:yes stop_codon:yes gene_type:complete
MTQKQKVHVVTRNNRRIEERNYLNREDAEKRAAKLVKVLKKYKDPDQKRVKIVETDNPSRIR